MAWHTLEEKLRVILTRLAAAEKRAQEAEEYAERTCRVYHNLYQVHADRLTELEKRVFRG